MCEKRAAGRDGGKRDLVSSVVARVMAAAEASCEESEQGEEFVLASFF